MSESSVTPSPLETGDRESTDLQRAITERALARYQRERVPRPFWSGKMVAGIIAGLAIGLLLCLLLNFMLEVMGKFFATPVKDPPPNAKAPYMISVEPADSTATQDTPKDGAPANEPMR